jgi:hypothetical protein
MIPWAGRMWGRALVSVAKPIVPRCTARSKRYNPDLGPPVKPGSIEEDAENLREFVNDAEEAARDVPLKSMQSRSRVQISVPVCGVALSAAKDHSVEQVAQVKPRCLL